MGTLRLVLDACGRGPSAELAVDRLAELLPPSREPGVARHHRPGSAEMAFLRDTFGFHELALEQIEGIEHAIFTGAEGAAADLFRLRKELLRVPRLLEPTSMVIWGFIHSRMLGWL